MQPRLSMSYFITALIVLLFFWPLECKSGHYGLAYWNYQQSIGKHGACLQKFLFEDFISPEDVILDFGCSGGFLLNQFECARKIGIEINPYAIEYAKKTGIDVYSEIKKVPDNIADVIISNHVLEHLLNPYESLKQLRDKLRVDGTIVIVVPSEQANNPSYEYKEKDINQHLYTWTPLTLGNLLKQAGFKIIKSEAIRHCWVVDDAKEALNSDLAELHNRCYKRG